jgi:hypothetical protein
MKLRFSSSRRTTTYDSELNDSEYAHFPLFFRAIADCSLGWTCTRIPSSKNGKLNLQGVQRTGHFVAGLVKLSNIEITTQ